MSKLYRVVNHVNAGLTEQRFVDCVVELVGDIQNKESIFVEVKPLEKRCEDVSGNIFVRKDCLRIIR